jgi:ribosomal protein S26
MKYSKSILSLAAVVALALTGCGGGGGGGTTPSSDSGGSSSKSTSITKEVLSGDITADKTLTSDKVWVLDGLVAVKSGAKLTIEPGTVIAGKEGTGTNAGYMIIDKGSQIIAEGTASKPIIFTSETEVDGGTGAAGQWGGLTLIGNDGNNQVEAYEADPNFSAGTGTPADNSGVLKYVKVFNSGKAVAQDKEINGISFVGVGSGTTVENIEVDRSNDDGVELWGGSVNLTNIRISNSGDDALDLDDGYSGTVDGLQILTAKDSHSGIEMSGDTDPTIKNFIITTTGTPDSGDKGGAIFLKKDGIAGDFENGIINHFVTDSTYGAIHSQGTADHVNMSFTNVKIYHGSKATASNRFTEESGGSAANVKGRFDAGAGNSDGAITKTTLSGDITANQTLTSDKVWVLDGKVAVKSNATLTIEPGTVIAGKEGTGADAGYMIIDKGSKINANATFGKPIIFTSETEVDGGTGTAGQWGGLTLIGNDGNSQVGAYEADTSFSAGTGTTNDNSGVLKYVEVYNSGKAVAQDKEINGISFVGVGSGTTVEDIRVDRSNDDGVELWGGSVNLTNITISNSGDDALDLDDGYSGTVDGLNILTAKDSHSGIEMSGDTDPTIKNFFIMTTSTPDSGDKGGAIFLKKDDIAGDFENGIINHFVTDSTYGAIHSQGTADTGSMNFTNITLNHGSKATAAKFSEESGGSATAVEAKFDQGSGNDKNE